MNARELVTTRVAEQARRFPDLDIAPLNVDGLETRDAALAWAIDQAVRRRWLTLVAVTQSRLSRPWAELEAHLQAVLLVGAAQLLFLDKLPDHAVVDEAVKWTKRNVRAKAGGLVNAVLRKVAGLRGEIVPDSNGTTAFRTLDRDELPLGDGRILTLREPVFDEEPRLRCAQQTSHPHTLLTHWIAQVGEARATRLALHNLIQPPTIVHDLSGSHATDASGSITQHLQLSPHQKQGFFVFKGDREELNSLLRSNPQLIVQDPTSAAVARATAELDPLPRCIIDACAGMGTKTRQLAALHPQATIIATDIAQQRSDILRVQFLDHPRVQVIDHRHLSDHAQRADLVLLDVPCSNSGVLARRVEAKYRFSRRSLQQVVDVQRQILADALPLLSDGGRIVYSTCSIDNAENHEQARWLCQWHPFEIQREQLRWPTAVPGDPPAAFSDGGYFAIFSPFKNRGG